MKIDFVNLGKQYEECESDITEAISRILVKGDFILNHDVKSFEENFAKYCNTKYCVGVDNGTNAIEMALRVLGIKKGDKVICPTNTFIADALAISAIGAEIVFCDVNEETQLVDETFLRYYSHDVKAIILVNLFGQLCDEKVFAVARNLNLKIVEDCAQSVGALSGGERKLRGDIGIYSFYPAKNLGACGDAGGLVMNDESYCKALIAMRAYGSTVKYVHPTIGMNARMDSIQAAILNVKLKYIDKWNEKRSQMARVYNELLKGMGDIELTKTKAGSVYHVYVIKTKYRDELQKYLGEHGIPTVIHYPINIHKQGAYSEYNDLSFPVSEKLAKTILSLPMHESLKANEVGYIVNCIRDFYESKEKN